MNALALFNSVEAGWWLLMAALCLIFRQRFSTRQRSALYWLAGWLTLFGVSDLVEVYSGAWWKPWWLLLLKGCCLLGMSISGWWLWRHRSPAVS